MGESTLVVGTDLTVFGLHSQPRSRFSNKDQLSSVNNMFIIWR